MSLSKAKNGIKNLIEYGIITKENREKNTGRSASNLYVVYVKTTDEDDIVNGKVEIQVRNPVPYIVTALYNALRYTADEIVKMEYGDDVIADLFRKEDDDEIFI